MRIMKELSLFCCIQPMYLEGTTENYHLCPPTRVCFIGGSTGSIPRPPPCTYACPRSYLLPGRDEGHGLAVDLGLELGAALLDQLAQVVHWNKRETKGIIREGSPEHEGG